MAGFDDAVVMADELLTAVAAEFAELVVSVDDGAVGCCYRDNGMSIQRGSEIIELETTHCGAR